MKILAAILVTLILVSVLIVAFKVLILSSKTYRHKRIVKSLLLLYVVVIIASVFIYELLPEKSNSNIRIVEANEENPFNKAEVILDDRPQYDDYIKSAWEFNYDKEELHLRVVEGSFNGPIVLERKTVNDGLVEAKYYASVVMDQVDVTQELHSLDVKLENDTIQLIGSSGVRLYNYNIYQKEFTITQFTSESDSILDHSSTKIDYLYLKIPKDLKLINHTNMYLEEER